MANDSITVKGSVVEFTLRAVLFHITLDQPRNVPEEAKGRRMWFPRRMAQAFRDRDGQEMISVSRSFLLKKIEEARPIHDTTDIPKWWMA